MHMELIDLTVFVAVAEEMSATKAASRLAMTQPGVSQHLSKLEEEIGQKLFDREGKKLRINDFGRIFLPKAKKLLLDAEQLLNIPTADSCPIGTLKLGLTDSSTLTVIPPAISKFREVYPGIHLRMDVDDSTDIEHGIFRGHYDLGIVTTGIKRHPLLDETTLYFDRIDALVAKDHPLAGRKILKMEELSHHPLILYSRRSRSRHIIDDAFHSKRIFPRDIIEVYTDSAAVKLVEANIGIALLPEEFIYSEMQKKKCRHLKIANNPFIREISLAIKRDAHLTEPARFFRDFVMEKASKKTTNRQ